MSPTELTEIIHDAPEKERFEVKDLDTANWAVGKMLDAESRIQEYRALADEYKRKIDEWLDRATKDDQSTIEFFQSEIRPFVEREVAKTNKQSMKLLGATVGFRKTPPAVVVDDEDSAVEYLETFAPEVVRTKKSVDKKAIKQRLESGEDIPHVHMEPGGVKFYVKFEEE